MLEYRDMAGNLINEGDFIVYAAHRGRSSVLKFGIVTRLVHPRIRILGSKIYWK